MLCILKHKIIISKDVVFEEKMFGMFELHNNEMPPP
jgi:hypothetical protein